MEIEAEVVRRVALPAKGVAAVIELLEGGATVPFISRYRKERTGGLSDDQVRNIELTLNKVKDIEKRRKSIIESLAQNDKLTPDLRLRLEKAVDLADLEDLYAPFKQKRHSRAEAARLKGLEPIAKQLMTGYLSTSDKEKIAGASDIIAEWTAESPRLRNITRNVFHRSGALETKVIKGKEEELESSPLRQYGTFNQSIRHIASHQYLALRRAEKQGLVRVKYHLADSNLENRLKDHFISDRVAGDAYDIVSKAVLDGARRLLVPSIENEVSAELKEAADKVAIDIFSQNLRELLMERPLRNHRILALDPGYRTGCKVVALDETGRLLDEAVIYPTAPHKDIEGATRMVDKLVKKHNLTTVAIGNGTASRETEDFIRSTGFFKSASIFIVSEDGASVYSASEVARKEFPDKDVTVRGAVSIGRRLLDPMAELVKIDPKSIGVGQYQHEVDQKNLKDALDYTLMACVNAVGIDLNTASESLLSYVSGIGPALAANIVKYREDNGVFKSRAELKKVPRLGNKAFEQAAGFLRVVNSEEPLDNTGIHPESYPIVKEIANVLNTDISSLIGNKEKLDKVDIDRLVDKGVGSKIVLTDILAELRKPGRDPRFDSEESSLIPSVKNFGELFVGQKVMGKVNNITAFGAFVNLGIKENGLIHISKISKKRISSVGEVLKLGQIVEATVLEIDPNRKRISLSLI